MQFTPQQLSGAGRYGSKTRIGNWLEDVQLEETKMADFRRRKDRGQLNMGFRQKKLMICSETVPHTYSEDGLVRFGDTVVVQHSSGGTLANDMWEETQFGSKEYCVSLSQETRPMARNTFTITRISNDMLRDVNVTEYEEDDTVHFGEPFHLSCNDSLLVDERTNMLKPVAYLASVQKNDRQNARISNRQMVFMSSAPNSQTVWRFQSLASNGGSSARSLAVGKPVKAGEMLTIQHRMTHQNLSSDSKYEEVTDFGTEQEVHCFNNVTTNKSSTLGREFSGAATAEHNARAELAQNKWSILMTDDPQNAVDNRTLPGPMTSAALLQKVREIVNARGNYGFRGLSRAFRVMDDGGDGRLDREDFKWGLLDYGVHLDDEQFELLLDTFDRDGDGLVTLTEFLVVLRGEMSARRMDFIGQAYNILDVNGDGTVTKEDIARAYDTSENPKVISGEMTPAEAIEEFMSQWDTQEADGIITPDEWTDYYRDISCSIDDDDYFELMMRNAWHISGGEGECRNTSCRRVLVKHSDGQPDEVVEIENDLGLDAEDIDGMCDRLVDQGVTAIASIELCG